MVPAAGAALIRVAAYPDDLVLPEWPDLTTEHPHPWLTWLGQVWRIPAFATAVTGAAPLLAAQVDRVLADETMPQRRLVESVVRYLLRWTTRATPFGTFAGVAPVKFGARTAVRYGGAHRAVTRPDGTAIAEHTARAEGDLERLRTAMVVTNALGHPRGDRWVLPCAHADGDRRWDAEIRLTGPVRTAIQAARSPISFDDLTAKIAGPATVPDAEKLLAGLVRTRVLLSDLAPSMTAADVSATDAPAASDQVAVDLRADVAVTLPPAVLREAARAAQTLTAVAPPMPAWVDYHRAFLERWGPGAAVALRDVLTVLGFPAGYRGSSRKVSTEFTARDELLVGLAQQAALDGSAEVVLDDEWISRLRGDDDRRPVPHTELRFTLAADCPRDLDRGAFTLTVLGGSRHAGVAAARFLHLLTADEVAPFRQVYQQLPTVLAGAVAVQLSGPPLDARLTAVARAPELLPVLPVGEFHPDPSWTVDNLAVAGDGRRLWLVSRSTGQPMEALLFNSVLLASLQQTLIRFLTELPTAFTAPCTRFDWGHATTLPFLPRVRRGRTVLHPARWLIDRTALPVPSAGWSSWRPAWQELRSRQHLPRRVLVGYDDVRLSLDLDNDTHLAILRSHLARQARTPVTEAPAPAGWISGRPAELVLTLTDPTPPTRPARTARTATTVQYWPGRSSWLEARLHGHLDAILADLARRPDDHLPPGWWFLRYPDPQPHLRLRIPLNGPDGFADVTDRLAEWAHHLNKQAVLHDYTLHPYRPETRHGTGPALAAAEAVFAADSRTVLRRQGGDRQAQTAAGMIAIADAFTGNGLRWLTEHVPRRTGPRLNPQQLDQARIPVHDEPLAKALATYRSRADDSGLDTDVVLGDLLHLHHARMIGVDLPSEQHCLRLARTIAHTAHVRHGR